MKLFVISLILYISICQIKAQCPPVKEDSDLRVDSFLLLIDYDEQVDYLAQCVNHFLRCEYFEEAIKWEWNKYIVARDFEIFDDQNKYLHSLENLIDSLESKITDEFNLEYKLQNLISWSELNYNSGHYNKSIAVLQKSVSLISPKISDLPDASVRTIIRSYGDLGRYYYAQQEFQIAIGFFNKAMEFSKYREDEKRKLSSKALYLGYIAYGYLEIQDLKNAHHYCKKYLDIAMKLYSIHPRYSGYLMQAHSNMARWHVLNNTIDSSNFYVSELKILETKFEKPTDKSTLLQSEINLKSGNIEEASRVINQFLSAYGNLDSFAIKMKIGLSFKIAKLLLESKDYETAKSLLNAIDENLIEKSPFQISNINPIFTPPKFDSLNLLILQLSLPLNGNNNTFLSTSDLANNLMKLGLNAISNKMDKIAFLRKSLELSEVIIRQSFLLNSNYKEQSFSAIESSKAIILFDEWRRNQLLTIKKDKDIFSEEKELINSIRKTKNTFFASTDSFEIMNQKNILERKFEDFELLKIELNKSHPKYYAMKYNWNQPSLSEVQNILHQDEVYINYFEGEMSLFAMLISSDSSKVVKIEALQTVRDLIDQYSNSILNPFDPKAAQEINNISYLLYEHLLAPFANDLKDRIIISPSGSLAQVPFSALRQNNDPGIDPIIIGHHAISYTPSASLFHQERTSENDQKVRNALLVAPKFTNQQKTKGLIAMRSSLGELIYNIPEVEMISTIVKNNLLTNENATKHAFLDRLENSDLLHFATHAKSNDDAPDRSFIAFYSGDAEESDSSLLYLDELSKLYIPAKMVVLSACETGLGKIYKGEGTMSLANACFYGGSHSVIASLWSVQDKTTSEIMKSFYRYLDDGQAKDKAMQLAKLDYLQTNSEDFHHPFFWAGFTVIGNTEALHFKKAINFRLGFLSIGMIAILVTTFLYFRKNRLAA